MRSLRTCLIALGLTAHCDALPCTAELRLSVTVAGSTHLAIEATPLGIVATAEPENSGAELITAGHPVLYARGFDLAPTVIAGVP